MASAQLTTQFDAFAELRAEEEFKGKNYVHIRIQQRNGRKSITTVQGLPSELDLKKILKALKKDFNCNGTVVADPEAGEVIQLSGDQRNNVAQFLTTEGICKKDEVKIHGF